MRATARKRRHTPHQPTGQWIRTEKRLAIYLRDGFTCLACLKDLHGAKPNKITLDHVIPRKKGGSNKATNLYTCCLSCNSARGLRYLTYFGPEAVKRIRAHRRRSLLRYLRLARSILEDHKKLTNYIERLAG